MNAFNRLTIYLSIMEAKIKEEEFLLLTSLPPSYDILFTTLLVGKES